VPDLVIAAPLRSQAPAAGLPRVSLTVVKTQASGMARLAKRARLDGTDRRTARVISLRR
jgi:hypothetical protein